MNPQRKLRQEEKKKLPMRVERMFSLVNKILQEEHDKIFGSNWKRMWMYFDKVMKAAFGD